MRHLRLTDPQLPFWVDVRVRDFGGRWLALADLADEPEVGVGETLGEALEGALAVLGPDLAVTLAGEVPRPDADSSVR